jgi:hypothetical protein
MRVTSFEGLSIYKKYTISPINNKPIINREYFLIVKKFIFSFPLKQKVRGQLYKQNAGVYIIVNNV